MCQSVLACTREHWVVYRCVASGAGMTKTSRCALACALACLLARLHATRMRK